MDGIDSQGYVDTHKRLKQQEHKKRLQALQGLKGINAASKHALRDMQTQLKSLSEGKVGETSVGDTLREAARRAGQESVSVQVGGVEMDTTLVLQTENPEELSSEIESMLDTLLTIDDLELLQQKLSQLPDISFKLMVKVQQAISEFMERELPKAEGVVSRKINIVSAVERISNLLQGPLIEPKEETKSDVGVSPAPLPPSSGSGELTELSLPHWQSMPGLGQHQSQGGQRLDALIEKAVLEGDDEHRQYLESYRHLREKLTDLALEVAEKLAIEMLSKAMGDMELQ